MLSVNSALQLIQIFLTGYLLGSLPTAYLMARFIKKINVFEVGSGNMGGTNVARAIGLHWGILTVVLDICKGMVAVYLVQRIAPDFSLVASIIGGVAAVAGHNWSIIATLLYAYYRKEFKIVGGKGAATAYGTMVMLVPPLPLIFLLVFGIGLAVLTRYASLGVLFGFSIGLSWTMALAVQSELSPLYIPYVLLLASLILWRFRENIRRLLTGTERKLGERA